MEGDSVVVMDVVLYRYQGEGTIARIANMLLEVEGTGLCKYT